MRRDPRTRLGQVLAARLEAELVATSQRDWRTATFDGAHHSISLALPASRLGELAAVLQPDAVRLPGQLVADLVEAERRPLADRWLVRVEALTLAAPAERAGRGPR